MKILAYILTIIASLSAVSCSEPTPIMAKYENGIITYKNNLWLWRIWLKYTVQIVA